MAIKSHEVLVLLVPFMYNWSFPVFSQCWRESWPISGDVVFGSMTPAFNYSVGCVLSHSSVHGILQALTLEWLPFPPPGDPPNPGIELASLMSPALAGEFFTTSTAWEASQLFYRKC